MKPRVYIETSVISYLASEPSRDLIVAAHQQITRDWWRLRRGDHELYVSTLVHQEARRGDRNASRARLETLQGIPLLEMTEQARQLARALVEDGPMPPKADADALHIAIAAAEGLDFLLTWNCTHIANARIVKGTVAVIEERGYECPVICTPAQLLEPGNA